MTAYKGIHLHIEARLHIGILAVRKRTHKQVNGSDFTSRGIHIVHRRTRPVNFGNSAGLMLQMVGQFVYDGKTAVTITELCVSHWEFSFSFAFFLILLPKELQRHANTL